ncbi:M48 family metallopeptidase [Marinoscillum sp. MHG1-6]|uniref:M48 family metallopeptidase n=1 Tax=Marinoscillum sp. MHG1-6 TaxID=2959627 RepID=UPI002157B593|nr:M48 family metallopeptidase [Marinoscillum sp. MHG1-6]
MKYAWRSLFFAVTIILSGCAAVPMTGRSQLSLVDNDEIFPMSFKQYEQVKSENKVIKGTTESQMIEEVGVRMQVAVEKYFENEGKSEYLDGYAWEFNLIENDETVNAWCMPGGKVVFYTGILPICENEEGIAVVMGHEIAHAIANHGRERMSQQKMSNVGLTALAVVLGVGGGSAITNEMIMQSAGAATSLGILKFSRKHESEADKMGLFFMAMAGYDPEEAPEFWERMTSGDGQSPPEFISTHPSHDTRIKDLNKNMQEALTYYHAH